MRRRSSAVIAKFSFILCIMSVFAACSVKEDRTSCPCRLVLNFTSAQLPAETVVELNLISADGFFEQTSVVVGEETVFEFEVPRTILYVQAFYGDEGLMEDGKGLVIPESRQCPAVHMESLKLDTDQEYLETEVRLWKSYCSIEVCFQGLEDFRYDASVVGRICGYGPDGDLTPGKFSYMLFPDEEGHCKVRVPRQTDASLALTIQDRDGYVKTFALGEYIAESGFDWKSPDLQDVLVEIDYARTQITFRINEWKKTIDFDVVI